MKGEDILRYGLKFLMAVIIYYIITWILFRLNYKPIFDWWSLNDGARYDKYFNLNNTLLAYNSRLLYNVTKLSGTPVNDLNIQQIKFFVGYVLKFQRYTDSMGNQQGILIPRSVTQSILPKPGDNDILFDHWLQYKSSMDTFGEPRLYGYDLVYTENKPPVTTSDGKLIFTYTPQKVTMGDKSAYGVYPSWADPVSWRGLITTWLGSDKWGWSIDTNGAYVPTPLTPDASYDKWFDNGTGRGDNFLARYNILPDAPIVVYFCNNKWSVGGIQVNALALQNLIHPLAANVGGWLGYILNSYSTDVSINDYISIFTTSYDTRPLPSPPSCKKPSVGNTILQGVSSAAPMLAFGVGASFWPALAFTATGLLQGTVTAIDVAKEKC